MSDLQFEFTNCTRSPTITLSVMTITQESVFSIIYHLKHDPEDYWIQDWAIHGPMLLRWLGTSFINICSFQWIGWLIHLPLVRPEALASLFHEYNIPSTLENMPTPFRGMLTIAETVPTTAATNQFLLGVMNSPALVLSISATTVFCIRWLCLDTRWAAVLAFFANFLANWLVVVAVLFGLDDLLARWYFLTPFTYVASVAFMWRLVYKWITRGINFDLKGNAPFGLNAEVWRGLKMGMTGFVLGLSEQTVLFQKLIQPLSPTQLHLLHGFNSGTVQDHMIMHGSYVIGLFVGGLVIGSIILSMLIAAVDYLYDLKIITQARLSLAIIVVTGMSLPYYAFDYVVTRWADFGPDSNWQETTSNLQDNQTFSSNKIHKRSLADLSRRDDSRPWLEINHIYPERKWLKKVRVRGGSAKPFMEFKIVSDASRMAGNKMVNPFRAKFSQRFDTLDYSDSYQQTIWDFFGPHFYKWKEDELLRQSYQRRLKAIVEFGRYRMIRIQKMHLKGLGLTKDGKVRGVIDTLIPYSNAVASPDLDIKKVSPPRPFFRDYFHWHLRLNDEEIAKREEQAAKDTKQTRGPAQAQEESALKQRERAERIQKKAEKGQFYQAMREELKNAKKDAVWELEDEPGITIEVIDPDSNTIREDKRVIRQAKQQSRDNEQFVGWPYMHARFWKQRAYSHFMYRRLIELDIDSLVARQPARNFVTDSEYKRLQYHQVALAAYHRSLRKYDQSIYTQLLLEPRANFHMAPNPLWRWDSDWKVGLRAKSLENYVYDQRFKGTHRVIQRLFLLDIESNPWEGQTFRYDQLLPLEEKDKGDRSNIWHEEIPREVREKVGAYDPFQSQRVTPMFDPVPFYIGWDPMLRKSVLTTSRLPRGTARVKLVLPSIPIKSDFLGIKRFLEETKLYEHVDFVADKDHEFYVHVSNPLKKTEEQLSEEESVENLTKAQQRQLKEAAKQEEMEQKEIELDNTIVEEHERPSKYRLHPNLGAIMQGWEFTKYPAQPFDFEFEQALRELVEKRAERLKELEIAREKASSGTFTENEEEIEVPEISASTIRRLRKKFARNYQATEVAREFERSRKPLVSERNPREFLSPQTWFKNQTKQDDSSISADNDIDQDDDLDSNSSSEEDDDEDDDQD